MNSSKRGAVYGFKLQSLDMVSMTCNILGDMVYTVCFFIHIGIVHF